MTIKTRLMPEGSQRETATLQPLTSRKMNAYQLRKWKLLSTELTTVALVEALSLGVGVGGRLGAGGLGERGLGAGGLRAGTIGADGLGAGGHGAWLGAGLGAGASTVGLGSPEASAAASGWWSGSEPSDEDDDDSQASSSSALWSLFQ